MVDEKALDLEFNRKKKQTVSGHVEPVVSLPNTEWEIKTLCGRKTRKRDEARNSKKTIN